MIEFQLHSVQHPSLVHLRAPIPVFLFSSLPPSFFLNACLNGRHFTVSVSVSLSVCLCLLLFFF